MGAGGGLVAGEVYRRFRSASKDAKDAKKLVSALVDRVEKDLAPRLLTFVTKDDLERLQQTFERDIARLARGSRPDSLKPDAVMVRRLDELERRMSAIEDAFDETQKEGRTWAELIREKLGRIEGMMTTSRDE